MQQRFETFTVLVSSISRSIRKIKTEEMAELGLRSVHVSCLYYLYREGALTSAELCELCEEDKANISRALGHLEREGYVCTRASEGHRYRAPLVLTEKGREAAGSVADRIDRILARAGEGIDEEARARLYENLSVISQNLQSICGAYDGKNCRDRATSKEKREGN